MALTYNAFGGNLLGLTNAAADTVYYGVIPGNTRAYARVAGFNWTAGNTANSFYGMRPIGRANIASASNSSVNTVTLDANPSASGNNLAAGDQMVYGPCVDGIYYRGQVSAFNATSLVVTFTANVSANVTTNTKVFNYGIFSDTDPTTGTAHPRFITTANTSGNFTFGPAGLSGHAKGDPLLIYSPNATNATNLNWLEYAFTIE